MAVIILDWVDAWGLLHNWVPYPARTFEPGEGFPGYINDPPKPGVFPCISPLGGRIIGRPGGVCLWRAVFQFSIRPDVVQLLAG